MLRYAYYPCLITAETEPPGRLHSSTGSPHEPQRLNRLRSPGIRASADPDYSGAFSVTGRAASGCYPLARPFRPRGDLPHRMSLSTLVSYRRRSAAADSGMSATPDSFRLSQNPLGAYHLPQALTSVERSRHRGFFR